MWKTYDIVVCDLNFAFASFCLVALENEWYYSSQFYGSLDVWDLQ